MKKSYGSVEVLCHFTCFSCKRWWSIADLESCTEEMNLRLYCPWCGKYQAIMFTDNE